MKLYDYGPSANCLKARLVLERLEIPYERVPVDIFVGRDPDARVPESATRTRALLSSSSTTEPVSPSRTRSRSISPKGSDLVPGDRVERAQGHAVALLRAEPARAERRLGPLLAADRPRGGSSGGLRPSRRIGRRRARDSGPASRRVGSTSSAGASTLADLVLACYAAAGDGAGIDMARYPAVTAWLTRLEREGSRPQSSPTRRTPWPTRAAAPCTAERALASGAPGAMERRSRCQSSGVV